MILEESVYLSDEAKQYRTEIKLPINLFSIIIIGIILYVYHRLHLIWLLSASSSTDIMDVIFYVY
jgi:hypothetical protein